MNRISTNADDWHQQCEKWAVAGKPFEVSNVDKVAYDLFLKYICVRYRFAMKMDGLTTAIFDPPSTDKT